MDSPEQRRKRKRFPKPTKLSNFRHLYTLRSLLYFLCFFLFFYLLFRRHTPSFHHPGFPQFHSFRVFPNFNKLLIQDRVSFPDHILLLLPNSPIIRTGNRLECIYRKNYTNSGSDPGQITRRIVLSVDELDNNRLIIRCPLPPVNYSAPIALRRRGLMIGTVEDKGEHETLNSWENLAYEAVMDGNTAVVFVKGISHRQGKESDPTQFRCHFGFGSGGSDPEGKYKYMVSSRAVTAAQEVVRCVLPTSIVMRAEKNKYKNDNDKDNDKERKRGIRVSVSFRIPRAHGRAIEVMVPSVAKLQMEKRELGVKKHELCACTMLWNQARSVREWITYHSWLGVEKWFVYDNNSDDEIKTVIENLDREGYNVSRHIWPWIKTQEAGFSHCAIRARRECNWVSFMDVDEFYYLPYNPVSGYPGQGSLRTLVSNFTTSSSIGEIRTSCHSFGPSGLTSRPKQGVTVGYTCRLQSPERHKSIIRPDALDANLMNVVHHFQLRKGFTFIDMPQSVAIINHYKYQVWEVFRAKFYRRVATYVADWKDNQNEGSRDRAPGLGTEAIEPPDWRLQFCEVWDTGLRDFVLANLGDVSTGVLPWDRYM